VVATLPVNGLPKILADAIIALKDADKAAPETSFPSESSRKSQDFARREMAVKGIPKECAGPRRISFRTCRFS